MQPNSTLADNDGRKLVHYAAANVNEEVLEFLLNKRAEANDADMRGMTPMMIACQMGRSKIVGMLIEHMRKE